MTTKWMLVAVAESWRRWGIARRGRASGVTEYARKGQGREGQSRQGRGRGVMERVCEKGERA